MKLYITYTKKWCANVIILAKKQYQNVVNK